MSTPPPPPPTTTTTTSSAPHLKSVPWLGKKKKKHVPIALPRQHKGMFDWAAARVRRTWSSTAGRNLRPCTLHQGLLFPPLHTTSLLLHHVMAAHSSSTVVHGSDVHWCFLFFCSPCEIRLYYPARAMQLPSVCGSRVRVFLSLAVCLLLSCQEDIKSKPPQAHLLLLSFCLDVFLFFSLGHVNHPDGCVKPVWWSHRLVLLPQA